MSSFNKYQERRLELETMHRKARSKTHRQKIMEMVCVLDFAMVSLREFRSACSLERQAADAKRRQRREKDGDLHGLLENVRALRPELAGGDAGSDSETRALLKASRKVAAEAILSAEKMVEAVDRLSLIDEVLSSQRIRDERRLEYAFSDAITSKRDVEKLLKRMKVVVRELLAKFSGYSVIAGVAKIVEDFAWGPQNQFAKVDQYMAWMDRYCEVVLLGSHALIATAKRIAPHGAPLDFEARYALFKQRWNFKAMPISETDFK